MQYLLLMMMILFSTNTFAEWKDPTQGKPFFPWVWENQFKPTIDESIKEEGWMILGGGAIATVAVHQYDHKIYQYNQEHPIVFDEDTAHKFGKVGNGLLGVSIAVTQIVFDQDNGLRHARALILTTLTHVSLAAMVRRDRPENKTDYLPFSSSFPSGHASSAFATAGSLAYAYGPKAGIPAYLVATSIAISRVREDRHWASDVVAGAVIGTFWARASYDVEKKDEREVRYIPAPVFDGLMITAVKKF